MEREPETRWANRHGRFLPGPLECFMILVIIGLLAFLMLSASGEPRQLARRSVCMKNLKEIGLAIRLYAEDNGGRFPCDGQATAVGSLTLLPGKYPKYPQPHKRDALYSAFVCPEDSMRVFARIAPGSSKHPLTARNLSYTYGAFDLNESALPDTPVACDRSSTNNWTGAQPWAKNKWTHESTGGNVLFADGHVVFVRNTVPGLQRMRNP
jgi:prepilin-type processing-associated H-X9-DG protein